MEGILISSVLSSVGLGVSSFFGFFLLKQGKRENRLLAWLLIALSLRIAKSIFYIHIDLPLVLKNLGLVANLFIGPLLYLYVRSLFRSKNLGTKDWIHFVLPLLYFVLSPVLPNGGTFVLWKVSYSIVLAQSFFYVFLTFALLRNAPNKKNQKRGTWVTSLIFCLTAMWLVYALIFIKVIPVYSLGPLTFSVTIFILLYIALNQPRLFTEKNGKKYANSRMGIAQGNRHFSHLKELLASEKLYKNPDISLSLLASRMSLLDRDVSYIINKHSNSNFSKFINGYRIEEAQRLMDQDPSKKLISIAFESGFNNLSTFNQVFKSITGQTPSEFKKNKPQHSNSFQDS